jgi:hypothetical protein
MTDTTTYRGYWSQLNTKIFAISRNQTTSEAFILILNQLISVLNNLVAPANITHMPAGEATAKGGSATYPKC